MIRVEYNKTQHKGLWLTQLKIDDSRVNRSPSAVLDFDPDSLEIYRDFFSYPTYQKYLSYDLSLNFRTNKDEDYIREEMKKSLQETIRSSLIEKNKSLSEEGIEDHEKGLTSLIKGHLTQNIINNFVKTIKVYKILNGTFQIDFNFTPRVESQFSYNTELSSNEYINWSQRGKVKGLIESEEKALHEKILEAPVPFGNETYQYKGGQITLWFKVMDMAPKLHLPNPKKRGIKGFIRLRRYFRAPQLANTEPFIEDKDFRLNMVHFKSLKQKNRNDVKENFVTVDLYKEFDLENLKPRLDRVELHFGKVLPDNFHKNTLIGRIFSYNDKVIKTSEMNLHGVLKFNNKDYLFETRLDKLVYDFEEGEFSKKSKIRTYFKRSDLKGPRLGEAQHMISQKLLQQHGLELIKSFKLGEIHSKFKGKK